MRATSPPLPEAGADVVQLPKGLSRHPSEPTADAGACRGQAGVHTWKYVPPLKTVSVALEDMCWMPCQGNATPWVTMHDVRPAVLWGGGGAAGWQNDLCQGPLQRQLPTGRRTSTGCGWLALRGRPSQCHAPPLARPAGHRGRRRPALRAAELPPSCGHALRTMPQPADMPRPGEWQKV
jgi:hypothetical protein